MKNTTLFLIIIITSFFSCTHDINTGTDLSDSYFEGYSILLATSNNGIGIIKVVSQDHQLKGVIYKFQKDFDFNTYDDIVFKLKEKDGVQYAYDIKREKDLTAGEKVLKGAEAITIARSLKMNLHNAAITGYVHDEHKFHYVGHIIPKGDPEPIMIGGEEYIAVQKCSDREGKKCESDTYYIKKSTYSNLNSRTSYYFQISRLEGKDIILGITRKHVHFGDKEPYVGGSGSPENDN